MFIEMTLGLFVFAGLRHTMYIHTVRRFFSFCFFFFIYPSPGTLGKSAGEQVCGVCMYVCTFERYGF